MKRYQICRTPNNEDRTVPRPVYKSSGPYVKSITSKSLPDGGHGQGP